MANCHGKKCLLIHHKTKYGNIGNYYGKIIIKVGLLYSDCKFFFQYIYTLAIC